tara:strand:+ start:711 stop:1187 length:477 start_codon:yes stop_codon:yes gene_type:complete
MENHACVFCKLDNNILCEENCCGIKICRFCVGKSRFCPKERCGKYLKNSIQDIIIRNGYFDEVLVLSKDKNCFDKKYGLTPIEMAIIEKDSYMVENLIRHGLCEKSKKVTDMAIESYNLEIIKILKDNAFPFDYQSSLQLQDAFPFLSIDEADKVLLI